jgi:predicted dithiol-disulfide oxidoreductase (DUF899 family)
MGVGMSVFKEEDEILYTYSTHERGLKIILVRNKSLDLTPLGRQGEVELKFYDEYDHQGKKIYCH